VISTTPIRADLDVVEPAAASDQVVQLQNQSDEAAAVNPDLQTGAQPQPAAPVFESQLSNEKAVMVEVTPLNLSGGGPTFDFEVAFNTHSVDLSFDPAAISILGDDRGREYPAVAWEGAGPGGHHRSGVLRFEAPETGAKFIEVIIQDVAGVPERVFQWELTQS
jgi:hypothetical protein